MLIYITYITSSPTASLSTAQACLSLPSSSPLPTPCTPSVPTTSNVLFRYADFLRAVYSNYPVAKPDKFPPTPCKAFIKLALVKKESVTREEADKFTHLTLRGDIDQILQVKEPIKLDDILKADDKVRLVVVEGAPGIGKSTLTWELCRQWPMLESLKRFSLVVLLRLREEGVQSATDISHLFPCGDDPDLSGLVAQEVKGKNGEGVLFVFDGFDEFPFELQEKSFVMDVIRGSKYLPKATVLVTSRPSASAQLQGLLQTGIGKHIEVVGFSEKEILEFAHSVFGDTNLFTEFRTYLTANPIIKGMMYNPLNCAIIVGLYRDTYKSGKPIPHTQTQLYTKLTWCLLLRYLKVIEHPLASKLPDNLQDLPHDSDIYQQLVKVGRLAFIGKDNHEVIFKQLPEGCSDLGLLVKHTALYTAEESITYSFFHLTLQEYMSAFYISQLPADEQQSTVIFSSMWRFVAGLTKMQNIGWDEIVREDWEYRKMGKYSWRGVQDDVDKVDDDVLIVGPILLECLYEAQDVESCESVFGQYRLKIERDLGLSNYGLYALGYCISLCSNTWSVSTSRREGLEMLGHGLKSVYYGRGSIEELDLVFSTGIMNEREYLLQLPHRILQHIKSLKLVWCSIDQRGFENLAECIPYLHSLTSLDIQGNLGGDGSLVKLFQALRNHRKIQKLDMTDIAIGMDDVAALTDLVKTSSSLRELTVGGSLSGPLAADVEKQLVRTVLLPSSLNIVTIRYCEYPLDDIETISDNILTLTFKDKQNISPHPLTADPSRVKGGTKLSHIFRKNTSLKELKLHIPLDKDEVHDILDSLKDNVSLEKMELYEKTFHSNHWIPNTSLTDNTNRVKGGTKFSQILRGNTSLKELTLFIPLDEDEVHDIIDSLKDNHSLEELWLLTRYRWYLPLFCELDNRLKFADTI